MRRPSMPPPRTPALLRSALAGFLVLLVLAVATLVRLPELHRALHGDGASASAPCHSPAAPSDDTEGSCAIALFAQGLDAPWLDLLGPRPGLKPAQTLRLRACVAPRLAPTGRHPPSHAPPARASLH